MIDVRKLQMLAELDRLGTIGAVADELHLTPPGVSMQLSALERHVGIGLTERHGRGVVLTPAGKVLAAHGRDLVDRLSLAELELDALRAGASGEYSIAAFPSAARTIVADVCRELIDETSSVSLRIDTPEPEGALEALGSGLADIAVTHSYSNVPRALPRGVDARHIANDPVRLAMPTRSTSASSPTVVDLATMADRHWIAAPNEYTCFSMVERASGRAGFRPRVVAQSLDFGAQLELVAAGVGVALIPQLAIDRVPDGVRLFTLAEPVVRSIFVATRTSRAPDHGVARLVERLSTAAHRRVAQNTQ